MPLRIFPVARVPALSFRDDFGEPRSNGRTHQGNDILAPEATQLFAVDDGEARFGTDPLGGNVVNLYAPDGTRYYYAHLSAFEAASVGTRKNVSAGDVLGAVGRTGDASGPGIPSHLHFEVHPNGGAAVDPYPYLTGAEQRAPVSTLLKLTLGKIALVGLVGVGWYWYAHRQSVNPQIRRSAKRLRRAL